MTNDLDLLVIGAGAAGLQASIYGATEGLKTLVVERDRIGGQAGRSTLIENVAGYPNGFIGEAWAGLCTTQAERFGALFVPAEVKGIRAIAGGIVARIETNGITEDVSAGFAVLALGLVYRDLPLDYSGAGIHYVDTPTVEAGRNALVIGGGNSAGQAAMNLADNGANVTLLVRRGLEHTMSYYLRERVLRHERITVKIGNVAGIEGNGETCTSAAFTDLSGNVTKLDCAAVCIHIGADPATDWLKGTVDLNEGGFIKTDSALMTSVPRVFAAGDVRADSIRRVAVATAEGAMAVSNIWRPSVAQAYPL